MTEKKKLQKIKFFDQKCLLFKTKEYLLLKHKEMKKFNTVFVDLNGYIENYVTKIYTKSQSGDKSIQGLQTRLNVLIKQSGVLPANAANLKQFWSNLTTIIKDAGIQNTNDVVYKEITQSVVEIGKTIAFICKRKHGGWKLKSVEFYPDYTDEDILKSFKVVLLNCYNDGTFKKDTDGSYYCVSNGRSGEVEAGIKHTLNNDFSTMTDEELMPIAKEFREYKLKIAGIDLGAANKKRLNMKYDEIVREMSNVRAIIEMIKNDRIPILSGEQSDENYAKLKRYIESGNADDWETLDLEEAKATLERFVDRLNLLNTEYLVGTLNGNTTGDAMGFAARAQ